MTNPQFAQLLRAAPAGITHQDALQSRAERLWPNSEHNRKEWLRAVVIVRATVGGWHADIKK